MTGTWPQYLGDAEAPGGCGGSSGPTGASFRGGNGQKRERESEINFFPCSS